MLLHHEYVLYQEYYVILQAVGIRLGFFIEILTTFVTAFIIAFCYSWSLTLLVVAYMPLIAIAQAIRGHIHNGANNSSKKGYEESSHVCLLVIYIGVMITITFHPRLLMKQ